MIHKTVGTKNPNENFLIMKVMQSYQLPFPTFLLLLSLVYPWTFQYLHYSKTFKEVGSITTEVHFITRVISKKAFSLVYADLRYYISSHVVL